MIVELGRSQGKKYVRLEYSDRNKWLIVENADQLFQFIRKSCTWWERLNSSPNFVCFGINEPNNAFVCKIFDLSLAGQFEFLLRSIPFELDGKIYNENIID